MWFVSKNLKQITSVYVSAEDEGFKKPTGFVDQFISVLTFGTITFLLARRFICNLVCIFEVFLSKLPQMTWDSNDKF